MTLRNSIVLVTFPFDDLNTSKVRPALCLTEPIGPHRHVVLAFITSQLPTPPDPTAVLLLPSHPDFRATGLRVASAVRLHRLLTVSMDLLRRRLGTLPPPFVLHVQDGLKRLFGL